MVLPRLTLTVKKIPLKITNFTNFAFAFFLILFKPVMPN